MLYGYARISKKTQRLDRQIESLLKYAEGKNIDIRTEKYTGRKLEGRDEWNKLFQIVEEGDTIVFDSVSRMSRNSKEGVKQYFELYDRNVNLVFIKEPYINTDTYKNSIDMSKLDSFLGGLGKMGEGSDFVNMILKPITQFVTEIMKALATQQIIVAFEQSEKEVKDISDRTKGGLKAAKSRGVTIGRPQGSFKETKKSISAKKRIIELSRDFKGQLKDEDVWKLCGISKNTYYKYKREITEKMNENQE